MNSVVLTFSTRSQIKQFKFAMALFIMHTHNTQCSIYVWA